ncbi:MAG: flagellar export chaperone FliS, partial [Planctomycetota bacterium]
MATESNTNSYLTTRVMSASPQELRLMLIEGAIRFARMGRNGLAKRDFEQWYNGLTQCQAILLELSASLRPEIAPELCQHLNALYTFMYRRMLEASSERNAEIVDEVIGLLEY